MEVKRALLDFFGSFGYFLCTMVRRETLDDLLYSVGIPLGDVEARSGVSSRALLALRKGEIATPRIGTVTRLAKTLAVDVARVRSAIAASRAAKG